MSKKYLIPPTEEQLAMLYKDLGVDRKRIDQSIEILRKWLSQEPHLPKSITDIQLEHIFLNNKGSLEKTKKAVDLYYTLRNFNPEILSNRDPTSPEIQSGLKQAKYIPIPTLTPEGYRVCIGTDVQEDFNLDMQCKLALMMREVRLLEDCSVGDILILDMKNMPLKFAAQVVPTKIKVMQTLTTTVFSTRIKVIHLVNMPPMLEAIANVVKAAMTEKLRNRVFVHTGNLDTLLKELPKNVLPEEFGGTAGKMKDLHAAWVDTLVSYRQWFLEQDSIKSNESKRIGGRFNSDQLFGIEGSFRKLNVD